MIGGVGARPTRHQSLVSMQPDLTQEVLTEGGPAEAAVLSHLHDQAHLTRHARVQQPLGAAGTGRASAAA